MLRVGLVSLFVGLVSLLFVGAVPLLKNYTQFQGAERVRAVRLEFVTRISGRDGCVEVDSGDNGSPVILSHCMTTSLEPGQQWTISPDGTIRSMGGKCMNASENIVVIYDCVLAPPDAIKWEFGNDGSIRNPHSGLVLTASRSDLLDTTFLTMNNYVGAVGQAWRIGDQVEV